MTTHQIQEAIEQMKSHCKLLEETDYHSVTARGVLHTLGYQADADEILASISASGFEYCLDPAIECNSGDPDDNKRIHPPEFACYWGPDQLRSRLNSLHRVTA